MQQLSHLLGHFLAHLGFRERRPLLRTPQLRSSISLSPCAISSHTIETLHAVTSVYASATRSYASSSFVAAWPHYSCTPRAQQSGRQRHPLSITQLQALMLVCSCSCGERSWLTWAVIIFNVTWSSNTCLQMHRAGTKVEPRYHGRGAIDPASPDNYRVRIPPGHGQRTASESCATSARSASTRSSSSSRWSAHSRGVPGTPSPPAGGPARSAPPCATISTSVQNRMWAHRSGGCITEPTVTIKLWLAQVSSMSVKP